MDLLKKLLSTDLKVTKQIYIKRLNEILTVTSFNNDDFEQIQERCTFYEGKGNKRSKKVDQQKATHMLIAKCLVEPNLNSKEALSQVGVEESWQAIPKLFQPGEQDLLENAIGECSGFVDGEVEIEEVKN